MQLEIVRFISASPADFVIFWSNEYQYDLEHLYDDNIGRPLTEARVWDLYRWKNGMKMSTKKCKTIRDVYLQELRQLPTLRTIDDGKNYIARLSSGAIWNIFWLHCINPEVFPIFDQHTYRSMAKIDNFSLSELPNNHRQKVALYFQRYIPFTKRFPDSSARDLDKALFAYGRHLNKGLGRK